MTKIDDWTKRKIKKILTTEIFVFKLDFLGLYQFASVFSILFFCLFFVLLEIKIL